MTHEEVVRAFAKEFGGEVRKETHRRPHWKASWRWRAQSYAAAKFLERLEPHLIVKHEQARLGAEFFREKRRYKVLPEEEIRKRENYRQRMWELNGRSRRLRTPFAV
jgi:hypothetical protein